MRHKFDDKPTYDIDDERPKVILRTLDSSQCFNDNIPIVLFRVVDSSSSYGERIHVVTKGQSKFVLKVIDNPKKAYAKQVGSSSSKKKSTTTKSTCDPVDQLQRTPTQISILEFLELPLCIRIC